MIVDYGFCGSEERFLSVLGELSSYDIRDEYELQIRIKEESRETTKELSLNAIRSVRGRVPLFLNADPNLAVELGYDGVHFPEDRYGEIERFVGRNLDVSVACHSLDSVRKTNELPITKILYSPIFKSSWKLPSSHVKGIQGLKEVSHVTELPVYGLGGISANRVHACINAGAYGIATLSGIIGSSNLKESAKTYLHVIRQLNLKCT